MALSVLASHLAAGGGLIAAESFPGRLPGVVVFGGGMLVGGLTVALVRWLQCHARSRRPGPGRPIRRSQPIRRSEPIRRSGPPTLNQVRRPACASAYSAR